MNKPLLILAFNRPQHVRRLIDSLRPHAPKKILVGIDGPRSGNSNDFEKISQVLDEIKKIDWTSDIELNIREINLGLRFAVADAVTWAIEKYGEVIVVEDDIEVGPEFLGFMSEMLDRFRDDETIGHISGYNLVPRNELFLPNTRLRFSKIPESYAWATWQRAWTLYDDKLEWAKRLSLKELRAQLGSWAAAVIWKINFFDAGMENINTWAYRWVGTLWEHKLLCVSPNSNLITYTGQKYGTHTRTNSPFNEIPVTDLPIESNQEMTDTQADAWIMKNVFLATPFGLIKRILHSIILTAINQKNIPSLVGVRRY